MKWGERSNLNKYITNFYNMSEKLTQEGVILGYFQGLWFLQGLPGKAQENIVHQA